MSDTTDRPRIERTPEQKAEERRLREMHRQNPVREIPADMIGGDDAAQMLKLSALIRREREALGLAPEQLAARAGIAPEVLTRLEAGQAFNPTVSILFRLARALGKRLVVGMDAGVSTDAPRG
jgi:ribosome-binding protein aMBF1 (putative translation factor)